MPDLSEIRRLIFESDNNACFIERDRILGRLEVEMADYHEPDRYALILSRLLAEVSTPVFDCDFIAGRVVEALPDEGLIAPNPLLCAVGHMSFDYEKLLRLGLRGILEEITVNADRMGDPHALLFAKNAEIVVGAIRDYAHRYSLAARQKGMVRMAEALATVPYEPAGDFYGALQSIWLLHMIASCYVGARDYAFGRFDQYLYPYYEAARRDGASEEELTELLAGFFMKTNEISGRGAHNYKCKPVLCQSTKQYVNIGGEHPNALSTVVLKAAILADMAQPQIMVLLKPDADEAFTDCVFDALYVLNDKMNLYHYEAILKTLLRKGICQEVAQDFTYSACCTFDLHYHTIRMEYYAPAPQTFIEILKKQDYTSVQEIAAAFQGALTEVFQHATDDFQKGLDEETCRQLFVLDSLMMSDSAQECRYCGDGKAKYNVVNIFCPGLATIGDSLMVLDKLVFREKRYGYREFMDIVEHDYEGHEDLRKEILGYTRFGNDTENDQYTVMAGNACLNAADAVKTKDHFYVCAGFYSLDRDNTWNVGATPDGRRSGDPFSENQSPTYGADRNGITALLKSLSKLPLDKTVTGGLNLTFSQKISPEILKALVLSYFQMGGLHVGISIIDRDVLKDAMAHPEQYKSLTVRLYGFSEYFVSLPDWQQLAVLNRTEYSA